jgi:hypothetical protein
VSLRRARRILFINQYYWPDHASTAQHLTDLAESLASEGYDCHVLCGQGRYKPGAPRPAAFEVRNGVTIHRVPATSLGRRSTLTRMIDYLSFYARAAGLAVRLPRYDAVVTLTTPPLIGLVGTLLRRLRGSRHVYWSMDLHPDASLALGRMSRRNPIVAGLAWLSNAVYRRADKVVVLGSYMADRIVAKGVRPERLATVPVWSRRDEIYPVERHGHALRESLGLADKFVVMYSGNLGLAHSFDEFLAAARRLADRQQIVFLFVGDGPRMAEVRALKEREGFDNIRVLDYFPREQLHLSLSTADVHLISMRREMTGIVVPGKLYGAMASGAPNALHRPRALRVRRHDPPRGLRSDRPPRGRRRSRRCARPTVDDARGRRADGPPRPRRVFGGLRARRVLHAMERSYGRPLLRGGRRADWRATIPRLRSRRGIGVTRVNRATNLFGKHGFKTSFFLKDGPFVDC